MSSHPRRLQIRMLKKAGKSKLPVINDKGDIIREGGRWGLSVKQLFWLYDKPVYIGDTHPVLQPVIDLLTPKAPA